jgi:rhamnosyl/mannosyltransferase
MENYMGELLPALAEDGIECLALVHGDPADRKKYTTTEKIRGVEVRRVPCYGRVLYAPVSPAFGRALDKAIEDFSPDLIHFHLPNTSAFLALLSGPAKKIPWVIHWHSDVVPSTKNLRLSAAYALYRPFEQAMLKRATAIIATSERYANASNALKARSDKTSVIPLGLPGMAVSTPHKNNHLDADQAPGRVLAIGRLTYYKGFDRLIEAARQLPDVKITIVGAGELHARLQKQIVDAGLEARVELTGALLIAELEALMAATDVLVLPSIERTEAFGLVLLEAMRAGKAVIASDIPGSGIGNVVVNGETGVLVKPGDVDALAAAISDGMKAPDKLRQYGENGRQRFDEHYRIERIAEKTKALYQRALLDNVQAVQKR